MKNQSVSNVAKNLVRFWRDEEGLVTLEWVALAAAVIVLAIGVVAVIIQQRVLSARRLSARSAKGTEKRTGSDAEGIIFGRTVIAMVRPELSRCLKERIGTNES